MTETDRQHELILQREEEKKLRNKAKAEAFKENMLKTFAELLKNEDIKKALLQEAVDASKNEYSQNPFFKEASSGTYRDNGEVITGLEPRPWEDD